MVDNAIAIKGRIIFDSPDLKINDNGDIAAWGTFIEPPVQPGEPTLTAVQSVRVKKELGK